MKRSTSIWLRLGVLALTSIAFFPKVYSRSSIQLPSVVTTTTQYHKDDKNRAIKGSRRNWRPLQHQRRSLTETQSRATMNIMSSATDVALQVRGGDGVILDLAKENYHMQALATYSTVTALLLNACITLYGKTEFPSSTETTNVDRDGSSRSSFFKFNNRHVASIFSVTASICIISGAFTALLFNILRLYSQSALAMINDEGYAAFRTATHIYTRWGFRGFLTTCSTFIAVLLMNLYTKVITSDSDGKEANKEIQFGMLVLCTAITLSLFAGYHIQQILGMATEHIFSSPGRIAS